MYQCHLNGFYYPESMHYDQNWNPHICQEPQWQQVSIFNELASARNSNPHVYIARMGAFNPVDNLIDLPYRFITASSVASDYYQVSREYPVIIALYSPRQANILERVYILGPTPDRDFVQYRLNEDTPFMTAEKFAEHYPYVFTY